MPHEAGTDGDPDEAGAADAEGPVRPAGSVVIDCDGCAVRGHGCSDCVVSVLLGPPECLLAEERTALEVLAEAGLAPRLRLVPIRREGRGLAC
jgi:hypothetical protein